MQRKREIACLKSTTHLNYGEGVCNVYGCAHRMCVHVCVGVCVEKERNCKPNTNTECMSTTMCHPDHLVLWQSRS